ncbi:MAG TPA: glycosyltransferase family 39 protein [Candidatus Dormibacteraeota bacterium]
MNLAKTLRGQLAARENLRIAAVRILERRSTFLVVAGLILGLAAAVRLLNLERFGFNSDEAVYSGQAAALAGHSDYAHLFGVFRAHPLLVHFIVSLVYRVTGVNDVAPRLVSVAFGLGLVAVGGAIGTVVRGRLIGLLTMLFIAISAYPVTVSRQILLDGPMAFFFALTLLFLALYVRQPRGRTLYAAACSAGLAFLSKETAILMVPAILVFFMLARDVPLKLRDLAVSSLIYALTIAPFPLSLVLTGGSKLAQEFFIWQVLRRPNHDYSFYLTVIPSIGIPLVALAVIGLITALRRRKGLDVLIVSLAVVVVAFFEAWPVKGFQYLIPLITPVALLAADGLVSLSRWVAHALDRFSVPYASASTWSRLALVGTCSVVLGVGSIGVVATPATAILGTDSDQTAPAATPKAAFTFTAGTGGLEASRPVGKWIRENTLSDAHFLTVGPSFANIIQFYGGRRALALSVSPNPLRRNPTYDPVENPDLSIKTNAIQYLVYDSYSAARTPFFAHKLMQFVHKYNGILVYADYQPVQDGYGRTVQVPVVLIYEVHP